MSNSRVGIVDTKNVLAAIVVTLIAPGLAISAPDPSKLPQATATSETNTAATPSSTSQTQELDRLPWQDRANIALDNQHSGALEAIAASVRHFGSKDEALEFAKTASANDPKRQTTGAALEANQTWFYASEGPYDEPGPVQVHMVNDTGKAIAGLLFEFIQGSCDEPDRSRSYHIIVAEQPIAPGDKKVLIVRIPPRYLTMQEQCGTILEAW